jgi:cytosine/adenosine deaminase-related metal-dependent hydrolase
MILEIEALIPHQRANTRDPSIENPWREEGSYRLRIAIWVGAAVKGSEPEIVRGKTIYIEEGVIAGIYNGYSIDGEADITIDLREGIILPPLVNLHTHTADMGFMELASDLDIDSIVGEPYGAKYIALRARRGEIPRYISRFLETQREAGVGYVADFREGGEEGILQGLEGSKGFEGIYIPMAMPLNIDSELLEKEVENLLRITRWIGISSPHYYGEDQLKAINNIAERLGGFIASHVAETEETRSEGDYEMIRDLERLRLVIHGVYLGEEELSELASRSVGLAICPRSNMWFSRPPYLKKILNSGIKIGIGSDNGGWVKPDLWRDMETLLLIARQQGVDIDPMRIIRAATIEGGEILGYENYIEEGARANIIGIKSPWIDLRYVANIPYAIVKRGGPESIRIAIMDGKPIKIDKETIYIH